ncbi:heme utilization cystosolic carrier protein HutX [Parasalinivibrio latis]|uniref:heme utilization cystosolic carrier protein HutX n=1 Tax=Parasalinivibrio latis TaxID=2952610 RepID=UPI0030DF08CA
MDKKALPESELTEKVKTVLDAEPHLHAGGIAEKLGVSEGEVVFSLPSGMVTSLPGVHAKAILESLSEWGPVTTIVASGGSIFEVKAPFPKGVEGHGYYNLFGKEGEIHGHLRLDRVNRIGLVCKPHRGQESYFIGFFDKAGLCIFKVYLGRDEHRQLFPEQVDKFMALKGLVNE